MYPIAWGVCEVENTENWSWFLTHLKKDLELSEGDGFTVISDMQKGLIAAVRTILPEAYHRMCARHIYAAWSKGFRGEERKIAFWAVAKSTYMTTLTENVKNLKTMGEGIFEALVEYPMHTWIKAFFSTENKCDVIDNNLCETFNGTILISRTKPLVSMLDDIRQQTMKRFINKRRELKKWRGKVLPKALEKLAKNELLSHDWEVVWNGEKGFDVTYIFDCDKRHIVFLDKNICSCREWDLTGIPCPHAIACIQDNDGEPEDYIADWYGKEKYMKAYGSSLVPVRGLDMLENNLGGCLPPPFKTGKGRPRKNRRKDPTEEKKAKTGKLTRVGIQMKCSLCRDPNHNYRKCPKKKDNPQYIPPSRKRALARVNAASSSNSIAGGPSGNADVAGNVSSNADFADIHNSANQKQFDAFGTSKARFKTSTEANLRTNISEAIEFAREMTVPRSDQKKTKRVLKLLQLKELNNMKRKKDEVSSSQT